MNPSPLTPLEKERLIKEFSEMFPSAPFLATESKIFSWFISKIEKEHEKNQQIDNIIKKRKKQESEKIKRAIELAMEENESEIRNLKDEISRLIKTTDKGNDGRGDELIKIRQVNIELWGLWQSLAECGQISIGKNFSENYDRLKKSITS